MKMYCQNILNQEITTQSLLQQNSFLPPLVSVMSYLLIFTTLPYNIQFMPPSEAGWRNNDVIYV